MTCREVAEQLLRTPNAEILVRVGNEWAEVFGVCGTGEHRNAVTLRVTEEISAVVPDVIVRSGNLAASDDQEC
jgi:hypothetical protein